MKGFIKVPRKSDGVDVLINIHKIRVVAPSEHWCTISLDQPLQIREANFNSKSGAIKLIRESILFETTSSFQQVVALIEAAQ